MNEQVVGALPLMSGYLLASLVALVLGLTILILVRMKTGQFYWAWFAFIMFFSVAFYDLSIWELTGMKEPRLFSFLHAVQTMTANRDFELPDALWMDESAKQWFMRYGLLLYFVAPVSIVCVVVEYFSGFIAVLHALLVTLVADSFVFSCLDERSFDLAQDVRENYNNEKRLFPKRVCIIFTSCDDADGELLAAAKRMKALCFKADAEWVSRLCSQRTICSIVLLEEDEEAAIITACRIKERAMSRRPLLRGGETRLFVLTDFRNTESLLFPELLDIEQRPDKSGEGEKVIARGIDLTRELVEQVMLRHPIFLLSGPRSNTPEAHEASFRELYERSNRHILIVGAGSVGVEFLSSALWASRIDGMHTKIDVIDKIEDPLCDDKPLAESRYAAEAPEIMSHRVGMNSGLAAGRSDENGVFGEDLYDLSFYLVDAESDAYVQFLEDRAGTLSYVFVALGNDLLNAKVAMRTRQVLERQLAIRSNNRDEYSRSSRPFIVTVIRDDDFATTVEGAVNEGQSYDIVCVGKNSDVLTYKMLHDLVGKRETEYKRRSSRASNTHKKYRLFAFARNLLLNKHGVRDAFSGELDESVTKVLCRTFGLSKEDPAVKKVSKVFDGKLDDQTIMRFLEEVDWTIDVNSRSDEFNCVKGWAFALLYQLYCTNGITKALKSTGPNLPSREWLLRMEHDRWNAYMRTLGAVKADRNTEACIFATGQGDKEKHRSNLMGLHPLLTPFDDLATLEQPIYELYEEYYRELDASEVNEPRNNRVVNKGSGEMIDSWARLADDNYIGIEKPIYKDEDKRVGV